MRLLIFLLLVSTSALGQSQFGNCMNSEMDREVFASIKDKIALNTGYRGTTFAMQTIQEKASEKDKAGIAAWADLYTRCLQQDAAFRRTLPADTAAVIEASSSLLLSIAAKLYNEEYTFGQFNSERVQIGQRITAAIGQMEQRETARQQANDDARRNMALQLLMGRAMQPQPAYQPIPVYPTPAPVITNCYRFGAQTTCSSR